MKHRSLVIIAEELDPACVDWLAQRCEVVSCTASESGRFGDLLRRAEGLIVRTYTKVDAPLLERAPRLRVVGRAGVGLDNIDLEACRARGVRVVHTPDANTRAVVEYLWMLILEALRPVADVTRPMTLEDWKSLRSRLVADRQLAGMTLGIVGLGRVGSAMARVGAAFDMRVLYNDLIEIPEQRRFGAAPCPLETVLHEADVFTLHVDDRPANRGLIGRAECALLRDDVIFVNASRGFVVKPEALAEFLRAQPAARAILDVHEPEPFTAEYPLLSLPNARLLPHLGAATKPAHRNMSWVVREVWEVLQSDR